jgi:uncharacterized C2H2 Zn-finger protein
MKGLNLESNRKLKCPLCGYEGFKEEFTYIYEVTLYYIDSSIEREGRERPVLVICPRCKQGFFLEDPYRRFKESELYKVNKLYR